MGTAWYRTRHGPRYGRVVWGAEAPEAARSPATRVLPTWSVVGAVVGTLRAPASDARSVALAPGLAKALVVVLLPRRNTEDSSDKYRRCSLQG